VEHVLDTFPMDHYRQYHLQRLEIAYVAEGHHGDNIVIQHIEENELHHSYRIIRRDEQGEMELCRVKLIFTLK